MGKTTGNGMNPSRNGEGLTPDEFKVQAARRATIQSEPQPEAETPVKVRRTRAEIERTRSHMEETLGAIGDKLSPERFKAEAVDAAEKLKEDAIQTAEHLKEAAVEAARAATHEMISGVKTATREVYDNARNRVLNTKHEIEGAGMTVIDTFRQNPIPTAMVGLGLYWLYQGLEDNKPGYRRGRLRRVSYEPGYPTTGTYVRSDMQGDREAFMDSAGEAIDAVRERAGEKVQDVRSRVTEVTGRMTSKAQDLGETIQDSALRLKRKAGRRIEYVHEGAVDLVYTNPLAVAGAAALAGIALGLLLPNTELENETMGQSREKFVAGAQEKMADLQDKAVELKEKAVDVVRETATVAGETLKQQAAEQGLTPG